MVALALATAQNPFHTDPSIASATDANSRRSVSILGTAVTELEREAHQSSIDTGRVTTVQAFLATDSSTHRTFSRRMFVLFSWFRLVDKYRLVAGVEVSAVAQQTFGVAPSLETGSGRDPGVESPGGSPPLYRLFR